MNFFISEAYAQSGSAQQPDVLGGLVIPMLILAVVFYFLLIRPQSRRSKEHRSMLEELRKGDEVATTGGLIGKVARIGENFVEIQVAENVKVRVQKHAIAGLMPKGTFSAGD